MTTHRALAALAAIAAILALADDVRPVTRDVSAVELAQWIKDRKPGLRIVDTRPHEEFVLMHVPGSVEERGASQGIFVFADGKRYILTGGIKAWNDQVVNARRSSPVTRYFARRHGC